MFSVNVHVFKHVRNVNPTTGHHALPVPHKRENVENVYNSGIFLLLIVIVVGLKAAKRGLCRATLR